MTIIAGVNLNTIIEYVLNTKDDFKVKEFNCVDSLVLSQLAYLHFENIVLNSLDQNSKISFQEIFENQKYETIFKDVRDANSNRELFAAVSKSPRFRNIELTYYINEINTKIDKQFSAITYLMDGTIYIAYRGTDSSFAGWKEDLNMTYLYPIPAQEDGLKYMEEVADGIPGNIIVGGHSKGGNIALYASMKCQNSIQERIIKVYNHDGPGFKNEINNWIEYLRIKGKVNMTIPQSSFVGMLMNNPDDYSIVKSNRIGIMQHDPFSWIVLKDDFMYCPKSSLNAVYISKTLNEWVKSVEYEDKALFIETLYQIVCSSEALNFSELTVNWQKRIICVLHTMRDVDSSTMKFLVKTILLLFKAQKHVVVSLSQRQIS